MGLKDLGSKPDWDELLEIGIREREQGSVKKAIQLLSEALTLCQIQEKRMEIRNHLGLAYFHHRDYENATGQWNEVLAVSNVQSNPFLNAKAAALRNLSRKELCENENDFEEAVGTANEARDMALKLNRHDLAWFTHGLFSAKLAHMKSQKRHDALVLKELVKIEKNELVKFWKNTLKKSEVESLVIGEDLSKLELGVWLGALLMDYAVVYDKVSRPLLKIARFLARVLILRRREEQIDKFLSELA